LANIESQKKRNRQNEKRRVVNSSAKSSVRTSYKRINKGLESREEKNIAQIVSDLKSFIKTIDTAARKGILHKKTAARKKSRMAKKVNALQKQA
jgi:small subunit ribosomal protein S20